MILVTGGAGFIGANFILDWFEERKEAIVNLDALTYAGNLENLASLEGDARLAFVHGDICDARLLAEVMAQYRPRAIVHFAAESHVDRSILGPEAFIQTNVVGTLRLLQAAREYAMTLSPAQARQFRFLHVSTDEVYGSLGPEDAAFSETTPYAPNSPYSASKASSDHLVRAYHHTYGLPTLTTHCSNNYGPLQFPEKLVPLVIHNALNGRPLPIYGAGLNVRDWLHVSDHCAALRRVLDAGVPGETYNIGGNAERTNIEVVQVLCGILDQLRPRPAGRRHQELIAHVQDRPGHDLRYAVDARKLSGELGWSPAETFEGGMRRTVLWYLEHSAWVGRVTSGEYQNWVAANYAGAKCA
jgi:dTDP-glucose 4,6-dehydratase